MPVIEMIDEIAEYQTRRTQTGDSLLCGVMAGVVVENYDKDRPGQVRVQIPVRDEDANVLKWAKVVSPYSGKDWGFYFQPEKGDQVLLAFGEGSMEMPYVIGALPRDQAAILTKTADEENQVKKIQTKNGSCISFTDHKDGTKKDRLCLQTSGETCQLLLDNEKKTIALKDKDKNCSIEMKLEDGAITVEAAKKINIKVGSSITISLNGDSGAIQVEADKLQVKAGQKLELKTDGPCKLSGQQTTLESSSMLKVSGSGMVSISGSPVKIG